MTWLDTGRWAWSWREAKAVRPRARREGGKVCNVCCSEVAMWRARAGWGVAS